MKKYLCKEYDELFVIEAKNMSDAIECAALWGGVVIKELGENE